MSDSPGELYVGIDLGGTTTAAVVARADGTILAEDEIPTRPYDGPTTVLDRVSELVKRLVTAQGRPPAAVGMGLPGLVDVARGVARFLPNVPGHWRGVEVGPRLTEALGCPVHVLNDVRLATLGELTFGHGRTVRTMLFFSLGTGVGGGVVIDGTLRLGPLGAAGELGHQTIVPDGPLCGCGNRGCLETLASGPAIAAEAIRLMRMGQAPHLQELVGGDAGKVTAQEVAAAARSGDAGAAEAIRRAATFLGIGVANLVSALHPELVVIGGGVADAGDLILDPVRLTIKQRVGMFPADDVRVEQSLLGSKAGLMGGVALALRHSTAG